MRLNGLPYLRHFTKTLQHRIGLFIYLSRWIAVRVNLETRTWLDGNGWLRQLGHISHTRSNELLKPHLKKTFFFNDFFWMLYLPCPNDSIFSQFQPPSPSNRNIITQNWEMRSFGPLQESSAFVLFPYYTWKYKTQNMRLQVLKGEKFKSLWKYPVQKLRLNQS